MHYYKLSIKNIDDLIDWVFVSPTETKGVSKCSPSGSKLIASSLPMVRKNLSFFNTESFQEYFPKFNVLFQEILGRPDLWLAYGWPAASNHPSSADEFLPTPTSGLRSVCQINFHLRVWIGSLISSCWVFTHRSCSDNIRSFRYSFDNISCHRTFHPT